MLLSLQELRELKAEDKLGPGYLLVPIPNKKLEYEFCKWSIEEKISENSFYLSEVTYEFLVQAKLLDISGKVLRCNPKAYLSVALNAKKTECTLLIKAACQGQCELVQYLSKQEEDFNIPMGPGPVQGITPLYIAAAHGHLTVVQWLVSKGADFKSAMGAGTCQGKTPLYIAAVNGHLKVVDWLVSQGADFKSPLKVGPYEGATPLSEAAFGGYLEMVQWLVSQGTDFKVPMGAGRTQGMTPLFIAAGGGHPTVVDWLVSKGADFKTPIGAGLCQGITPLYIAAEKGHLSVVKWLVSQGADFKVPMGAGNRQGVTPLCAAAARGHLTVVQWLVSAGADFKTPMGVGCSEGKTPLFLAAGNGQLTVVQWLVSKGADFKTPIEVGGFKGWTTLCSACRTAPYPNSSSLPEVISYLLKLLKETSSAEQYVSYIAKTLENLHPFFSSVAGESRRPLIKLLVEEVPASRGIVSQKWRCSLYDQYQVSATLKFFITTQLDSKIKHLVLDHLNKFQLILADEMELPGTLVEVTELKNAFYEKPKNPKEFIFELLRTLVSFYDTAKLFNVEIYGILKSFLVAFDSSIPSDLEIKTTTRLECKKEMKEGLDDDGDTLMSVSPSSSSSSSSAILSEVPKQSMVFLPPRNKPKLMADEKTANEITLLIKNLHQLCSELFQSQQTSSHRDANISFRFDPNVGPLMAGTQKTLLSFWKGEPKAEKDPSRKRKATWDACSKESNKKLRS